MSSVAELSRAGSPADLEVALEVADTRRLLLPAQWDLEVLAPPLEDQAVSVVASVVASMAAEAVADSGEVSKIVEVTVAPAAPAAAVDEEALATKVVEASEARTATVHHQMLQLDQAVLAPVVLEVLAVLAVVVAMEAEVVVMEPLDHRIATVVVVGMTRAVAVAHMMTDPADIVAAAVEGMEIAMLLVV